MPRYSLMSLAALLMCIPGFAQEKTGAQVETTDVVQSQMIIASPDEAGGAPTISYFSTAGDMGMAELRMGGDFAGMPAPDVFSLANNKGVQKEIELVDEQLEQLKEINRDFSRQMREHMEGFKNGGQIDLSRAKEMGEAIKEMNAKKRERMEEVFLPHQLDRLRQISRQTHMKRSGESAMLANADVVEALGLTEEQQKKLKERAKELKEEMEKEIQWLKEKARKTLFRELTREQQEKLKQMLGDDFEVKTTSFADRVRRRSKQESRDQ